jgi:hypothetical protein
MYEKKLIKHEELQEDFIISSNTANLTLVYDAEDELFLRELNLI